MTKAQEKEIDLYIEENNITDEDEIVMLYLYGIQDDGDPEGHYGEYNE